MWIIQEPNVRIMKQNAFWRGKNGQRRWSHNFSHPGRIACCSARNSRPPGTKALHTIRGNNTSIVSSTWWWAYKCPKHVEQIISAIKHSVASIWFSSLRWSLSYLIWILGVTELYHFVSYSPSDALCHTDVAKEFFPPISNTVKRSEYFDVYKMGLETLPCLRAPHRFAALDRPLLRQLCLAGESKRMLAGMQQRKIDKGFECEDVCRCDMPCSSTCG